MLAQYILRTSEMAHADDHDLAQPPVEALFPSHRFGVVEPAFRERRRIEQHAIHVDQLPAPSGAVLLDDLGQFGVVLLLNQRNAGHALLFPFVMPGLPRSCMPLLSRQSLRLTSGLI